MPIGADILLVIAMVVAILALSSVVAGWTTRRWPIIAVVALVIAACLLAYVHLNEPGGLEPMDVPNAFISVAARILN